MKYFIAFIFSICFISTATAVTIKMEYDEKHGINIPQYKLEVEDGKSDIKYLILTLLADSENFPFSSKVYGSVFYKILNSIKENTNIHIYFTYKPDDYSNLIQDFERGEKMHFSGLWSVYYKELPYSRNQYVYPALMTNNIHLITTLSKKIEVTKKDDLKNYKGARIKTDRISDVVDKELKSMNVITAETYDEAYEELLSGKVDYILASYYPSLIAAYSLGVKKYISYSKEPIWRMPLFIRYHPSLKNKWEIKALSDYLKSPQYKRLRDEAFQELIDIYKNNTSGVVPPTYVFIQDENATQSNDAEQTLEN